MLSEKGQARTAFLAGRSGCPFQVAFSRTCLKEKRIAYCGRETCRERGKRSSNSKDQARGLLHVAFSLWPYRVHELSLWRELKS